MSQYRGCLTLLVVLVAVIIAIIGGVFSAGKASPQIIIPLGLGALVLTIVGIVIGRLAIADSFYEVTVGELPATVKLGESFRWQGLVKPKRPMRLGAAKLVLRCREHAINRGGTSDSHYRKTIYEEAFELGEGRRLHMGEIAELRAEITIPTDAVPSYSGRNNFIEWSLTLVASVPGFCPDIKQETPVQVLPQMDKASDRGLGKDPNIPAKWEPQVEPGEAWAEHDGVRLEIRSPDAATVQGLPAIPVGGRCRLNITVHTDSEFHCRGVRCWIGCRVHGSGSEDTCELWAEQFIHEGDILAGHTISHSVDIAAPDRGPVSFQGRYVKCDWLVRVRVDIPVWRDKRLDLPFLVTPRLTA
jgi:hypothetical protein